MSIKTVKELAITSLLFLLISIIMISSIIFIENNTIQQYTNILATGSPDVYVLYTSSDPRDILVTYSSKTHEILYKNNIIIDNSTILFAHYAQADNNKTIIIVIPIPYYPYFVYKGEAPQKSGIALVPIGNYNKNIDKITIQENITFNVTLVRPEASDDTYQRIFSTIKFSLLYNKINQSIPVFVVLRPTDSTIKNTLRELASNEKPLFAIEVFDIVPVMEDSQEPVNHNVILKSLSELKTTVPVAGVFYPVQAPKAILSDGLIMILMSIFTFIAIISLYVGLGIRLVFLSNRLASRIRQMLTLGFTPLEITRATLGMSGFLLVIIIIMVYILRQKLTILSNLYSTFRIIDNLIITIVLIIIIVDILLVLAPVYIERLRRLYNAKTYISILLVFVLAGMIVMFGYSLEAYAVATVSVAGAAAVLALDGILGVARGILTKLRALPSALIDISGPLLVAALLAIFAVQPLVLASGSGGVYGGSTFLDEASDVHRLLIVKAGGVGPVLPSNGYVVTNCIVDKINDIKLIEYKVVSEYEATGRTYAEVRVVIVGPSVARMLNITGPTLYTASGYLSSKLPEGVLSNVSVSLYYDVVERAGNLSLAKLRVVHEPFPLWISEADPRGIPVAMLTILVEHSNAVLAIPDNTSLGNGVICGARLVAYVNPSGNAPARGVVIDFDRLRESVRKQLDFYQRVSSVPVVVDGVATTALVVLLAWEMFRRRLEAAGRQLLALGVTPGSLVVGSLVLLALSGGLVAVVLAAMSLLLGLPAGRVAAVVLAAVLAIGSPMVYLIVGRTEGGTEG